MSDVSDVLRKASDAISNLNTRVGKLEAAPRIGTNPTLSNYVHVANANLITAQHTFNPVASGAPFILGANAQGELVTGLRANYVKLAAISGLNEATDGLELADTVAGEGLQISNKVLSVDLSTIPGSSGDIYPQYVHISIDRIITAQHTFGPDAQAAPFVLGANAQGQLVTGLLADQVNKSIGVSGLGLSGGGALTADRTITLTSSSNPGVAASILASDANGRLRLEGLGLAADSTDDYVLNVYKAATGSGEKVPVYFRTNTSTQGVSLVGSRIEAAYQGGNTTTSGITGLNAVAASFNAGSVAPLTAINAALWAQYGGVGTDGVNVSLTSWVATGALGSRIGMQYHDGGAGYVTGNQYAIFIGALSNADGSNIGMYMQDIADYAIYTNAGLVRFGDWIEIDSTQVGQLWIKNSGQYGYLYLDGSGHLTLYSVGNLLHKPAGDVIFDPEGNDVYPSSNYDLNLGLINKKWLTLHAAELWVETLVAQNTIATIGGRILVGPTTTLTRDILAAATTIYVKHNQMSDGDTVYMEAGGKIEFILITSGPTTIDDPEADGVGEFSYTVTRNLDGTGANDWYAGDAVFNSGQADNGFIDIYSIRGVKSGSQYGPTIVGNVRGSSTYNDWTEHWAIGNLNGLYGYGADTYGVGLGKYDTDASYLTADATNGIRIMHGATQLAKWAIDGSILIGQVAANQDNISIASGALSIRNNTVERIGLTAAGVLTINDSDGAAVFTFDASTGAEFTKPLTLGTNGGIYQGSGTFDSPTTGLKLFNSSGVGKLSTYNTEVEQVTLDTDGKLKVGAGRVLLDSDGMHFSVTTSTSIADALRWLRPDGDVLGYVKGTDLGAVRVMDVVAGDTSSSDRALLSVGSFSGNTTSAEGAVLELKAWAAGAVSALALIEVKSEQDTSTITLTANNVVSPVLNRREIAYGTKDIGDNTATGIFTIEATPIGSGVAGWDASIRLTLLNHFDGSYGYANVAEEWIISLRYYLESGTYYAAGTAALLGRVDGGSKSAGYADVGNATVTVAFDSPSTTFTVSVQADVSGSAASPSVVCDWQAEILRSNIAPAITITPL